MTTYKSLTSGKWTLYTHPLSSSGLLVLCAIAIMMALKGSGPAVPWEVCAVSILFFTVYNQVSGLFLSRWGLYMGLSYVAFIAHMVVLLVIAGYVADAPLAELPKFKKTFALLSVFFFLLTILAGVYRVALYMLGMPQRG